MTQNEADTMRKQLVAWIEKTYTKHDKAKNRGDADRAKYLADYLAYCEARLERLDATRGKVAA